MIEIKEKAFCCGCNACVQRCPKQCISMHEDEEGFLYPRVDKTICIECGLCEKVCPVINQNEPRKPLKVYAAYNKDEKIRRESSSGGVFTAIAEQVIDEGGIVFGACFDENWEVKHDYTETKEGLKAFRGSKYVQSRIKDNYQKAEHYLKEGRKVLFSGTPCQIARLKKYLCKEYENLLTVDFICHGVPSPKVWRMYLNETIARQCGKNSVSSDLKSLLFERNARIEGISFRDKRLGWKKYSFALTFSTTNGRGEKNTVSLCEVFTKNAYMRGFIDNVYLRPSCYRCSMKQSKGGSDLMIGDLWGAKRINKVLKDDDKGLSSLMVFNRKGEQITQLDNLHNLEVDYAQVYSITIDYSSHVSVNYSTFKDELNSTQSVIQLINKCAPINYRRLMKTYIRDVLCRLGLWS